MNEMKKRLATPLVILMLGMLAAVAFAGDLNSPAAPSDSASAMFTFEDLYNRLLSGVTGAKRTGSFTEPTSGPGSTMHNLNQIMEKAPAIDAAGASTSDVLISKTFWGLTSGTWGPRTGAMPNRGAVTMTPGTADQAITQGFHDGTGKVTGDANLVTGNIKSGATIFGVAGKTEVVDTTSGNAAATDLRSGKKAYVAGVEVTGTIAAGAANTDGTNGTTTVTIPAGIYAGNEKTTAADTNLVTGNIKSGATIFGVAGKTEVVDTTSGNAAATDLRSGKKAYVAGVEVTGTIAAGAANTNGTNGTTTVTIPAGIYAGTEKTTAADTNLVTGNIKSGVTIFGVAGTSASSNAVPKTGQTPTEPVTAPTGSDGDLQMGAAWPNPRFTDNFNGTVTDNLTGLIWLKNANFMAGGRTWAQALDDCAGLAAPAGGLTDGSIAGDWRLPNRKELDSLIAFQYFNPALPNTAGTGQWTSGDPFTDVQSHYYWSSTTVAAVTGDAWNVHLDGGYANRADKTTTHYVWPVCGG